MIKDNVERVLENIKETALKSGRNPDEITLVAVTKTVTAKEAREVMDAGVFTLGENRVQELLDDGRRTLGRIHQNRQRIVDLLAADQVNNNLDLTGRNADIAGNSVGTLLGICLTHVLNEL